MDIYTHQLGISLCLRENDSRVKQAITIIFSPVFSSIIELKFKISIDEKIAA